jgi:hypothetical protein
MKFGLNNRGVLQKARPEAASVPVARFRRSGVKRDCDYTEQTT